MSIVYPKTEKLITCCSLLGENDAPSSWNGKAVEVTEETRQNLVQVHPKSDCTTNPTGMWHKNKGKVFHSWKRSLGLIFMVKNILGLVLCFLDLYTWQIENVSRMGQFGRDI